MLLHTFRAIANLVNLSTPLGLALADLGRGKMYRRGDLVIAEQVSLPLLNAGAMTIGNVVLIPGSTLAELERRQPLAMRHESVHAWQYVFCLGLPFLPLYTVATGWSWLRTGDRASANFFEVQADLEKGGYQRRPAEGPLPRLIAKLRRGSAH